MQNRPYPRYAFRCEAQFCPHGTSATMPGTISDISLSGCYIETLTPLPIGTQMDVTFASHGVSLALPGVVRVVHPNMGMGVQFSDLSGTRAQALEQVVRAQNHSN
jgi:hypothetical protein